MIPKIGGNPEDIFKIGSENIEGVEVHAIENAATGVRVELKVVVNQPGGQWQYAAEVITEWAATIAEGAISFVIVPNAIPPWDQTY